MKSRILSPLAVFLVLTLGLVPPAESDVPRAPDAVSLAAGTRPVVRPAASAPGSDTVDEAFLAAHYRLQGQLQRPDGTPYTQTVPLLLLQLDPFPSEWAYTLVMTINGEFDVALPAGLYRLGTEADLGPYHMPRTKIDLQNNQVGLIITLLDHREPPVGDAPPDASLIAVGPPDTSGYATVTGASGSVPAQSAVAVANLNAGTVAATTADASGAFTTTAFYAPPGSWLLVKYDLDGDRVVRLWDKAQEDKPEQLPDYMLALPGTIIYAGEPSPPDGSAQAFSTAGAFGMWGTEGWAGWWLSGTLQTSGGEHPGLQAEPGETVTLTAGLRLTAPGLNCAQPPTLTVITFVGLHQDFGTDGRADPWGMGFEGFLFTPTGLPIEFAGYTGLTVAVGATAIETWTCASSGVMDSPLVVTFTLPSTLTEATYIPEVTFLSSDVPLTTTVPAAMSWFHEHFIGDLPPIRVGDPAAPRIPWTLLADYPVNGHRGVQAREDIGLYQLYPWVVFPPQEAVIPRIDERTGEPLAYRLEPGANWISATDRRFPNPPHVPLDLPSGHLTIELLKPDGSLEVLGPAPIRQSSVRTPATPGGDQIGERSGSLGDVFHLATMTDTFAHVFDQYGPHVVFVFGEVNDIYGNSYTINATYDVNVARVLDLDPGQLPTTPYVAGDAFAPGLHVFPPVPAEVSIRLVQMPFSDPSQAITTTTTGRANRFGYFQPLAGTVVTLSAPGEFRVDVTAVYSAPDDTLWMGAMTWGNVVEGPGVQIEAHGRRGLDYTDDTIDDMAAWFEVDDLVANRPEKVGVEVYYPYWSGDVHWGVEDRQPGNSIQPTVTFKDIHATGTFTGPVYDVLKANFSRGIGELRRPPSDEWTEENLQKRMAVGEAPLFITTGSGANPALAPHEIDQWGYWYATSQRPDVRVREILSQDMIGVGYWGFDDTYNYQIGEPADGDQPGDLKWEFGGVVLRTVTETSPLAEPVALTEYAIYSSLWVLLPDGDATGARVTPPFQDGLAGVSLTGGPILTMTVEGEVQEIDMLFLPKCIRPGDVLEVGDVIAFCGHVGPPLDSRVTVTFTSPSDVVIGGELRANKIGWVHDPDWQLSAFEPGRWTVDVAVLHDRDLAYAAAPTGHNTGTVMGTTGRYEFYVVEPGSPRLFIFFPQPGFIYWPQGKVEPIHIRGLAPGGTSAVHYTFHDKGVVMGQGSVTPTASGLFTITYDAKRLHDDFSMLSLTAHEGRWEGLADEVAINLLAVGGDPRGNTVTLIGEQVFVGNEVRRTFLPSISR